MYVGLKKYRLRCDLFWTERKKTTNVIGHAKADIRITECTHTHTLSDR